jgi:hypothetical protein
MKTQILGSILLIILIISVYSKKVIYNGYVAVDCTGDPYAHDIDSAKCDAYLGKYINVMCTETLTTVNYNCSEISCTQNCVKIEADKTTCFSIPGSRGSYKFVDCRD